MTDSRGMPPAVIEDLAQKVWEAVTAIGRPPASIRIDPERARYMLENNMFMSDEFAELVRDGLEKWDAEQSALETP